jgi:hypothetical protein
MVVYVVMREINNIQSIDSIFWDKDAAYNWIDETKVHFQDFRFWVEEQRIY